ncbi:MAG: prephenate dehydrogenase/arogenate dehydrogenase family protein [Solirubrobacteraceae bacterium]|nr:prephenate dehydrogenase/arogenate dehydrogenase family protein [Solirubrobacteraceae bacterium]
MRIALIGVGLIGGSVGLAARERIEGARVVGWDPNRRVLDAAIGLGAIDEVAPTLEAAVAEADLVIVAAPMGTLPQVLQQVLRAAPEECAITDVGSVKRPVIDAAAGDGRLVAGHPLAGSESSGVQHARADLFDGATWYLVPHDRSHGTRFEQVHRVVSQLGARPTTIDAATHDRLMAIVSHLPHVLANVLVEQVGEASGDDQTVPATGPSFRDVTRVAGANPALWAGIYAANGDALAGQLDRVIDRLSAVRDQIRAGEDLGPWQADAALLRRRIVDRALTGNELVELRTVVPNRPGAIAELALACSKEGINIVDISVAPLPGGATGMVALWCPLEQAGAAIELLSGLGIEVIGGERLDDAQRQRGAQSSAAAAAGDTPTGDQP